MAREVSCPSWPLEMRAATAATDYVAAAALTSGVAVN
jgi:hypothetical protein